jgi:hypothetical protein
MSERGALPVEDASVSVSDDVRNGKTASMIGVAFWGRGARLDLDETA